jgi:hypothetical protein
VIQEIIDKAMQFLSGRRMAYRRTFNLESVDVQMVLADLAKFCRAHDTPYTATARETDLLIGRHEVWLRIQQHLNLTDEELWALYGPRQQQKGV